MCAPRSREYEIHRKKKKHFKFHFYNFNNLWTDIASRDCFLISRCVRLNLQSAAGVSLVCDVDRQSVRHKINRTGCKILFPENSVFREAAGDAVVLGYGVEGSTRRLQSFVEYVL